MSEKMGVKYMQRWEEVVYARQDGIAEGKELGIEIVPAACAYLCPSGHITDEALKKHRDGILEILWQDLLLYLHMEKFFHIRQLRIQGLTRM